MNKVEIKALLENYERKNTIDISAANTLIVENELPLTVSQVIKAFKIINEQILIPLLEFECSPMYVPSNSSNTFNSNFDNLYFLMTELVSSNIEMFVAIILALNDGFSPCKLLFLINYVYKYDPESKNTYIARSIGLCNTPLYSANIYINLLSYKNFSLNNLNIEDNVYAKLEKYKQKKYGCDTLIKPALK